LEGKNIYPLERSMKTLLVTLVILVSFLTSQNITFQNLDIPVEINDEAIENPFFGGFNKPRIQSVDWDTDGDPDFFLLDEDGFLRYYRNEGTSTAPDFRIQTSRFQDLPPASWFYFNDFDQDGNMDYMTSHPEESGHLHYYQNIAGELSLLGEVHQNDGSPVINNSFMTPTFSDIDNDSDPDFFTGNYAGTVTFYENVGWDDNIPVYQFISATWQNISIIGNLRHGASAIQFIDLDGDDDFDLSWGDYFHQSLYIIWNIGSADFPVMDIFNVIEFYPEEDPIITAGQNMPGFVDLDGDNDADLIISVLSGSFGSQLVNNLYYYENIGSQNNPVYEFVTTHFLGSIDLLTDTSPELADIDNDGDLDLFIGNGFEPTSFPWAGRIHFLRNHGTPDEPSFVEENASFLGSNLGNNLSLDLADIDADGDLDAFIGNSNGFILFFRNSGTAENFEFTNEGNIESVDLSGHSSPDLVDIDNDGDLDLICGETSGLITLSENTGTAEIFQFQPPVLLQEGLFTLSRSAPEFVDLDSDGDLDLLIGSEYSGIMVYQNTGSTSDYYFAQDYNLVFPETGLNTTLTTGHLSQSTGLDILTGLSTGGLYHLSFDNCIDGDMNDDGAIDVLDIIALISFILLSEEPPDFGDCTVDMNQDQQVDILDIIILVTQILSEDGIFLLNP
jgi:large repetitive protein